MWHCRHSFALGTSSKKQRTSDLLLWWISVNGCLFAGTGLCLGCTWPDLVSRGFCGYHLFFLEHLLSVRQGQSLKELFVSRICAESLSVPSVWIPSRQRRGCTCISYCTCNKDKYKLRDHCVRCIRTSLSCNLEPPREPTVNDGIV